MHRVAHFFHLTLFNLSPLDKHRRLSVYPVAETMAFQLEQRHGNLQRNQHRNTYQATKYGDVLVLNRQCRSLCNHDRDDKIENGELAYFALAHDAQRDHHKKVQNHDAQYKFPPRHIGHPNASRCCLVWPKRKGFIDKKASSTESTSRKKAST